MAFSLMRDTLWPCLELDRFLIDNRYQGKGYGKAALKLLITRLFCEYQCNTIYLSLYQQNKHAYHLYTSRLVFKKMVKKTSTGKLCYVVYRRITSLSDNSTKYPIKLT